MKRSTAAAVVLTALLFGTAYLTAGEPSPDTASPAPPSPALRDSQVTLEVLDGGTVRTMTLETYLLGVVRGEMPASFEMEALRAQAAAERSYVWYRLSTGRKDSHPEADLCTDFACCSAYLSEDAAREKLGADFPVWETRIAQAVADTDGQVVLYQGEPIQAVFHSSSAGQTAASQDVWSGAVPYLVSVESPESADTVPNYYSTASFTAREARSLLLAAHPELTLEGTPAQWLGAVTENPSGRVDTVTFGTTELEGTEVRRIFSLRSACFTVDAHSDSLTFHVTGYGHGVGMSQYGADQLARQGKTWQEILRWYYTGCTVENAPELP